MRTRGFTRKGREVLVESREGDACRELERCTIGCRTRGLPHSLERGEHEACQSRWIFLAGQLAGTLRIAEGVFEDRPDFGLIAAHDGRDILILCVSFQVRAQQQASALMLCARLFANPKEHYAKAFLDGQPGCEERPHRRLRAGTIFVKGLQIQRSLIAERVVQALAADLGAGHEIVERRVRIAVVPEDIHGGS